MKQRRVWLIFDPRAKCWWGPNRKGLYPDILNAGLYTMSEVKEIRKEVKNDPFRVERTISIYEYREEIERLYHAIMR